MRPGGILALDTATRVGWSYAFPGDAPIWGARRAGLLPGASTGAVGCDYHGWLSGQCELLQPRWIYYESPYIGKLNNAATVLRLYGMEMLTLMVADERNIAAHKVVSSTMMKFFSGFGRWPKGEKKAASIRMAHLYGWMVESDDESDALGILLYAEGIVAPWVRRSAGVLFARRA